MLLSTTDDEGETGYSQPGVPLRRRGECDRDLLRWREKGRRASGSSVDSSNMAEAVGDSGGCTSCCRRGDGSWSGAAGGCGEKAPWPRAKLSEGLTSPSEGEESGASEGDGNEEAEAAEEA